MLKQLNKHISYEVSKSRSKLNPLTYRDFLIFRKKFLGMFVLRGRKSFSMKMLHYILLNLKRLKVKTNPMKLFFLIIQRVTPFLTLGQKKYGINIITVPSLLFGNKKNVILLNWIFRKLRNKSNVFGVKKEDVLKNLTDIYKFKGSVLKLKEEHNNKVILTKINLKNEGISFSASAFKKWERENFINSKYDYWKQEIARLNEDLQWNEEEIDEEFLYWKEVEREYKFIKTTRKFIIKNSKKNEQYLRTYKKLFVK